MNSRNLQAEIKNTGIRTIYICRKHVYQKIFVSLRLCRRVAQHIRNAPEVKLIKTKEK